MQEGHSVKWRFNNTANIFHCHCAICQHLYDEVVCVLICIYLKDERVFGVFFLVDLVTH